MLVNLRCNKAQVASQMLQWLSKSTDIQTQSCCQPENLCFTGQPDSLVSVTTLGKILDLLTDIDNGLE